MADAIGTTAFTWTPGDQLASENGPFDEDEISYVYTNRLRASLSLLQPNAAAWVQNYGYQTMMRPNALTSPAGTFAYSFGGSGSDRPQSIQLPNGGSINNQFDNFARLQTGSFISAVLGAVDQRGYVYDAASQVTQQTFFSGNLMNYGYDNIGQLTTAQGFEAGGTPARLQEQFGYAYDKAWNLNYRTNNSLLETFAVNSLNELSSVSRSGTLTVAGTSTSPASSVNVSGTGISGSQAAAVYADSTWALAGVTPANGQNRFTATATDNYNRTSQASTTVNLPASSTFTYDANGNLLGDGTRSFAYDDENQLTSVWVTNAWRSDFLYDGLMRRRIRKEFTWSGGAWVQTNEVHYLYDGNLVIQERYFDPQVSMEIPNDLVTYTRGNDLSGSLQGAGGIGGLLARSDSALLIAGSPSGHAYYGADANGNITCLINESNMVVARYEYAPFGNLLSKSGLLADANLYRFSSKELHVNSGLSYYGYRFYDPDLQRWVNRDPFGEYGGLNQYDYAYNDPLGLLDAYGLALFGLYDSYGDYFNDVLNTFEGEAKGAGANLSFGLYSPCYRNSLQKQGGYVGQGLAMAGETLAGGLGGWKAAGEAVSRKAVENALEDSAEFSHSIPASWLRGGRGGTLDTLLTDSKLNGNYVSPKFHYLTDADRFPINKDLAREMWGEKWPAPFRQLGRVPLFPAGIAAGAGAAAAGAAVSQAPAGPCQ